MAGSDQPNRSTRLASAAQIAGIIGVVVCLAIIAGAWLGRGVLARAVDDLSANVDDGIQEAISATGQVADRLDLAGVNVGEIVAQANALAATPSPAPDAVAALADRIGQFSDGYRALRIRYQAARDRLTESVSTLRRVAAFVPGVQAPPEPVAPLGIVDAKLQAIDDAATAIWPSPTGGSLTSAAATAIADRAASIQGTIGGASGSVRGLAADFDAVRTRAARFADSTLTVLTVATAAISLLFVWVLVLNVALWLFGRAWKREARREAVPDVAAETPPDGVA